MFTGFNKFHFIGVGGAGMSGLAYILHKMGKQVSGSDAKESAVTKRLQDGGITVYIGHKAEQVNGVEVVVLSTAIHEDNQEYLAAKNSGLKIVHRSDIMAYIMNARKAVAVAGAHGKTTTTAMISCITSFAGVDTTYLIGGDVKLLAGNAHLGSSTYAVTEADESDGSFLKLTPYLAVITNIEDDHMDFYKTRENINKAFQQFLTNVATEGAAVVCYDNATAKQVAEQSSKRILSYAIDADAYYRAQNIVYSASHTSYDLYKDGSMYTQVVLSVPGKHNVLNSLAAIAVALEMGVEMSKVLNALLEFTGAKRRFEVKYQGEQIKIVDDYAHHPTEIAATIKGALQTAPQRLVCVFQPHRYTRTQLLFEEFVNAFVGTDVLILTDIYSAGESTIDGISSKTLYEAIKSKYNLQVLYIPELADIPAYLLDSCKNGDLIITMGAGNVYIVGEKMAELLKETKE